MTQWRANPEKGAWLLPSRKRYDLVKRFMNDLKESKASTCGFVLISDWDAAGYADVDWYDGWAPIVLKTNLGRPESQGDKIRAIWDLIVCWDWIGWLGDDQVPMTKGWDQKYIEALNGCNIVTCNDDWAIKGDDQHKYERMAGAWVFSGPLLRAIGYMFPNGMHQTCMDDAYEAIDMVEPISTKLRDVTIKHLHPQNGLRAADETYEIAYGKYGSGDESKWRQWRDNGGLAQAASNIKVLKESMKQ